MQRTSHLGGGSKRLEWRKKQEEGKKWTGHFSTTNEGVEKAQLKLKSKNHKTKAQSDILKKN